VRPEIGVVPDVLADGNAQPAAAPRDRRDVGGWFEVAPFVEHVVGRQQRLAHDVHDAAAIDQRRAVGDRPSGRAGGQAFRKADDHRRARRHQRVRQRRERRRRRVQERGTLEQVARRIAGQRQLGKDCQLGPALLSRGGRLEDQPPIAGEVADGRVDLSERDLHRDRFYTT